MKHRLEPAAGIKVSCPLSNRMNALLLNLVYFVDAWGRAWPYSRSLSLRPLVGKRCKNQDVITIDTTFVPPL